MATDTTLQELVINDYTRDGVEIPETMPADELSLTPDLSLEKVVHDATLTGDGTVNSPLSVVGAGGSGGASDDGLRGDYCCRYGVIKWPNGSPTIGSGNTASVPAGLVLNVPGTVANPSTSLITLASAQTATLTKTTNSLLVYVQGLDELVQCDKICFSKTTPADDDSTCQLWWNGEEMQFRSNDQGNVWIAVRAAVLGELIYTDGSLTRINRTGWYHYLPDSTPTE